MALSRHKALAAVFLWLLGACLTPAADSSAALPSDEDVWAYIVHLYGYDSEELAKLENLSAQQKDGHIQRMRQLDGQGGVMLKHPDHFTPEERIRINFLRDSLRLEKAERQRAWRTGNALTRQDAEKIVALAVPLIEECREMNHPLPYLQFDEVPAGRGSNRIPPEWAFLSPQRIRAYPDSLEIQLYINAMKPDGPQIRIDVVPNREGDLFAVRYSTNVSLGKSWQIDAPRTHKKAQHGPR